ncbi:MAG TPA: orotidine-5'-phosphate decarboxylase [Candidatus Dormibacteraeota bacterium]|nr:orotidine-5'-phosphate decarboxylase [Candidatus Dormibacteraeota bacterium]
MEDRARRQLIVALDFSRLSEAIRFIRKLKGRAGLAKIGSQLFTAEGPAAVERVARLVPGIFLDLKFCDIPNTVAGAVSAAARLPKVRMLTLHTTGGLEMMRAAKDALRGMKNAPKLLGVTILTSLDDLALERIGLAGPVESRVVALARLAQKAGIDGIVASAREIEAVRKAIGSKMLIVVPGVRPGTSDGSIKTDDQARVATPRSAIRAGADYLVVGRPITAAPDPVKAADAILLEMRSARK